jgi:hypothetical protein
MLKQLDTLIGLAVVMSMVSVIIMTITQAISSLVALRGRNLLDALETLFHRISPGLTGARELAELVLKRPVLSDSTLSIKGNAPEAWKLASAISAGECLEAIRRIATLGTNEIQASLAPKSHGLITNAQVAAQTILTALGTSEARESARAAMAAATDAGLPAQAVANIGQHVNALLAEAAGAAMMELQKWSESFATVQTRAEQWFTVYTRRYTVVLAFIMAFALQLDALQLVQRLSDDTGFRNAMVSLAKPVQTQVDEALNKTLVGTVYYATLKEMKAVDTDVKTFTDPTDQQATRSSAEDWLRQQAQSHQLGDDKIKGIIERFGQAVQVQAASRIDAAKNELGKISALYNQSNLQLIPSPYPDSVGAWLGFSGNDAGRHFIGMIAAAMLLTLGATFWFNTLKSLTNLRSAVAEQIDKGSQTKPKS